MIFLTVTREWICFNIDAEEVFGICEKHLGSLHDAVKQMKASLAP